MNERGHFTRGEAFVDFISQDQTNTNFVQKIIENHLNGYVEFIKQILVYNE